jgi:hypothetical protein
MTAGAKSRPRDLRQARRRRQHGCWDHLIVAPLWVAFDANLGTLLRTCDAVGACMAVPDSEHYRSALVRGDTLARRPHIHWLDRSPARSSSTDSQGWPDAAGRSSAGLEAADADAASGIPHHGDAGSWPAHPAFVCLAFRTMRTPVRGSPRCRRCEP